MRMEGSSGSCWQKSDSSRGLKRSGVSDRNPSSLRANSIRSLDDTTNAYEYILGRRRELGLPRSCEDAQAGCRERKRNDISLRQWLDNRERAEWVIYNEHVFTSQDFLRTVSDVRGEWLIDIAPHYFDLVNFPHCEAKRVLEKLYKKRSERQIQRPKDRRYQCLPIRNGGRRFQPCRSSNILF